MPMNELLLLNVLSCYTYTHGSRLFGPVLQQINILTWYISDRFKRLYKKIASNKSYLVKCNNTMQLILINNDLSHKDRVKNIRQNAYMSSNRIQPCMHVSYMNSWFLDSHHNNSLCWESS